MGKPEFKVGDRVKVVKCSTGDPRHEGRTGTVRYFFSTGAYDVKFNDNQGCDARQVELVEKTLDNLQEGDMVVNDEGEEKTVLGVCGKVYLLSYVDDQEACGFGYTAKALKSNGWTVKGSEPEETVTAMTVEEVAKKLKIKNLHIIGEDS